MPGKEVTTKAESVEFRGEIQDIEVRYTCYTCCNDFTQTFVPGDPIPELVHHEECPDDPSWQTGN